jgi:hypothetical protein
MAHSQREPSGNPEPASRPAPVYPPPTDIWDPGAFPAVQVRALPFLDLAVLYLANPITAFFSELFGELQRIRTAQSGNMLLSALRLFFIATLMYSGSVYLGVISNQAGEILNQISSLGRLADLPPAARMTWLQIIIVAGLIYLWVAAQYWYFLRSLILRHETSSLIIFLLVLSLYGVLFVGFYGEHWTVLQALAALPDAGLSLTFYLIVLLLPAVLFSFWLIMATLGWLGCFIVRRVMALTITR